MRNRIRSLCWLLLLLVSECEFVVCLLFVNELLVVVVVVESVLRNALDVSLTTGKTFAQLCCLAEAEQVVLRSMHAVGGRGGVAPYELPRAVLLEWQRFTPDNALLTPSFKTNRIGLRAKVLLFVCCLFVC